VQLARVVFTLTAALALAGCPDPVVVRVVDGRSESGRFIGEAAYALFARGAAAEASGNLDGAVRAFSLAAREDPDSPDVWTHLGAVHCRLEAGEGPLPTAAADAFAHALAADPAYGPLYRERARCLAARGQAQAARADADRALSEDPDNLDTALVRADVLSRAGLRDEALRALRAAAARRPASAEPWRALDDLAHRAGDAALAREAEGHLAALATGSTPARGAPASLSTVDAALRSGDLAEAQRRALALRLPSADLALRAAALGLAALAREQAALVLGADPGDASARIALAAAADLGSDLATLSTAMRSIPRRSTAPSALGRWLFADVLRRRVGPDAALAWLGAAAAGGDGDPLLAATEKRVRDALATP
jgi:tetratricopeptide (TPR) repeat protein